MSELLTELARRWDQGEPPNLATLVKAHDVAVQDLLALVQDDHGRHIRCGNDRRVETYLELFPELNQESASVDLIYNEFLLREEAGETPDVQEYVRRFPRFGQAIRRQLELHELMEAEAARAEQHPQMHEAPNLPQMPGFELMEVAGQGAMGVVYKARDVELDRIVAIKMLLGGRFGSEDQREQLRRESALAAKLRHPGIVAVHQVGVTTEEIPFLVMEFVAGGTLAERLRRGPMQPGEAVTLARAVAVAVAHAHESGVVHRDLKPANILMDESRPKVSDFGLSRRVDADLTAETLSGVMGTPQYMSPEQADPGMSVGPATDVYSLGAVLYEMLSGRPPLDAATPFQVFAQIGKHDPPRLRTLNPALPADLETICEKCLQKEPDRRYRSVGELIDDLQRFEDNRPIAARPVGLIERAVRWCVREPRLALAAAASLLMAVAVIVVTTIAAVRLGDAEKEIASAVATAGEARVSTLLNAAPDAIPFCIEALEDAGAETRQLLAAALESEGAADPAVAFRSGCGLASLGDVRVPVLLDAFAALPPSRGVISAAVTALQPKVATARKAVAARALEDESGRQVRFAYLALFLGENSPAEKLTTPAADPEARADFVDTFRDWIAEPDAIPRILQTSSPDLAAGLCLGLGSTDPLTLRSAERTSIAAAMRRLYQESRHGAVHSSAGWALKKWQNPLPVVSGDNGGWQVNSLDMTLLRINPGSLSMGKKDDPDTVHDVTLTRGFLMGDREVTCRQFAAFAATRSESEQESLRPSLPHSPEPDCPIQNVTWVWTLQFCNWLSDREGRTPCYVRSQDTAKGQAVEVWTCDFDGDGYRLPTEAEWEYAARARAETRYSFGREPRLEPEYVRTSNLREIPTLPCGSLLPNAWGLFDMQGNVWERCWDEGQPQVSATKTDPLGPNGTKALPNTYRIIRGGGIANNSGDADCEARGWEGMNFRSWNSGFRVVRTIPD